MNELIERILSGDDLSTATACELVHHLVTDATQAQIGGLLTAMRAKSPSESELAGFARGLREAGVSIDPAVDTVVDTCGTGGDAHDTINVSTTSALVAAAAGATVAKHGNHGVSSASGSADVMAELGVAIKLDPADAEEVLETAGFAYLHAPAFHPSMAAVAPARRQLGIRTIFNLVGPLTNPAGASRQLIGAYDEAAAELLAGAAAHLGVDHALVVHGAGLDEIALHGPTTVVEVCQGRIERFTITPDDIGLSRHPIGAVAGGTPAENAAAATGILRGEVTGAPRDIVLANTGAALYVAGEATSVADGVELASNAIDDGRAIEQLQRLEGRVVKR